MKNQFIDSFNRKNLFISVEPRFELLGQTLAFLKKHTDESGIIYCQRRKHVNWLCENLVAHGISALPYHAGLDSETRKQNQEVFINGDIRVIVATIAFGMGIDKADVRFVLHAWLPKNPESYYQEIGRAGRDGKSAECLLLFSRDDEDTINEFIDDGHPTQRKNRIESLQNVIAWANSTECRRKGLLDYFGEPYENENCGMCDNCCKKKIEKVDLTVPAQKFLSCIVRVEESDTKITLGEEYYIGTLQDENTCIPICLPAGVLYMIDILRGETQENIIEHELDKLSTWGIGKEYSKAQWYYLAFQLFQNNLFERDGQNGSLNLTAKGTETNTKNVKPDARFWGFPVDMITSDSDTSVTVELDNYESAFPEQNDYDLVLYEKLRDKRRTVAEAEEVKASIVVPLASLKEMAAQLPQTVEEFRQIPGIGEVRTERYADIFLPLIREYCQENETDSLGSASETPTVHEPGPDEPIQDNQELFEQLRVKRAMVADQEKLPAYYIFSNKTLQEMAIKLPQSKEAFLQINGVGDVKVEKYADDFLPIIRYYCKEQGINSVVDAPKTLNTYDAKSEQLSEYSPELFELLQIKRDKTAKAEGVLPYEVFHDEALKGMATYFPISEESFKPMLGVGPKRSEKYADDFLPIIQDYCKEHGIDS